MRRTLALKLPNTKERNDCKECKTENLKNSPCVGKRRCDKAHSLFKLQLETILTEDKLANGKFV